jgi:hypothetical protein
VRFPDRFWRRATDLSHAAKGLYATVATFTDYRTGETFVSNLRLQQETGLGREKIKSLLRELERAGFIERTRELRCNLKSKRHIRCKKYVCSDGLESGLSARQTAFRATENQATIFTPVRSSVTPKTKKSHRYPTQDHTDCEAGKQTIM